jgi:hypothetical protein
MIQLMKQIRLATYSHALTEEEAMECCYVGMRGRGFGDPAIGAQKLSHSWGLKSEGLLALIGHPLVRPVSQQASYSDCKPHEQSYHHPHHFPPKSSHHHHPR